jgi:hypothetical protein
MGILLYKGPVENLEGGSFTRDSEIQMKEGSGNRAPLYGSSLRGTRREGSSTGGPERHKGRLRRRASLSIGVPLGNLEGRFIYWGLQETVKEDSISLHRGPIVGQGKGTLLYQGL